MWKTKLTYFILTIAVLCLTVSCVKNCHVTPGEPSIELIAVSAYNKVDINHLFNVYLVQDTSYFIEIKGPENLIDNVEVSYQDSVVSIDNDMPCFYLTGYQLPNIYLHFHEIEQININESSTIRSTDIITTDLHIESRADLATIDITIDNDYLLFYTWKIGGRYTFKGYSDRSILIGHHTSIVDASELKSREANVYSHSIGDHFIGPSEHLNVRIFNSGNIYYKGNPKIHIDTIAGSGKLLRHDQ